MATERSFVCSTCSGQKPTTSLHDALLAVTHGKTPVCCGKPMLLRLSFAFGLGAAESGRDCTVLDAFLPGQTDTWKDEQGRDVEFYPFLVLYSSPNGKRGAWLPYWHIVDDGSTEAYKYGQWAPNMDLDLFEDLVAQARAKGYLP